MTDVQCSQPYSVLVWFEHGDLHQAALLLNLPGDTQAILAWRTAWSVGMDCKELVLAVYMHIWLILCLVYPRTMAMSISVL